MFENFERLENEPLERHSTIKIGGAARWMLFPKNEGELKRILSLCESENIKYFLLGNGSNVLFSDAGFNGAIINLKHFDKIQILNSKKDVKSNFYNIKSFTKNKRGNNKKRKKNNKNCKNNSKNSQNITKNLKNILKNTKKRIILFDVKPNSNFCQEYVFKECITVEIGAGINLFALNIALQKFGLSGLEFSYGIPATLGGFLVMNGGCFGHEICELVEAVSVLQNGRKVWLKKDRLKFAYRSSNLKNCIILSAKLRFFREKSEKIAQNMDFYLNQKRKLQPCDMPSLGSVFKRCKNAQGEIVFPAKVFDELGLKGFSFGGAQVSSKHAGFIVNTGGATSQDVHYLIQILEKALLQRGVRPQREIIIQE